MFKSFYYGFTKEATIWYPYHDEDHDFELPSKFKLDLVCTDEYSIAAFRPMITPGLLPVNFFMGRGLTRSYEFYNPSIASRQLGFGQLPIFLFFTDRIKPREALQSALEYDRLKALTSSIPPFNLELWSPALFSSKAYSLWWTEWKLHLLCSSAKTYCQLCDPGYDESDEEVKDLLILNNSIIRVF